MKLAQEEKKFKTLMYKKLTNEKIHSSRKVDKSHKEVFYKTQVAKFIKSCSNSLIVKKQQIEDLPLSTDQPSNVNSGCNNTKCSQLYEQRGTPSTASRKVCWHNFVGSQSDNTHSHKKLQINIQGFI